jgi:hypothetical protein
VPLADEGVDVWAPVMAEAEGGGVFRLPTDAPPDEAWVFAPGSRVRVERRGPDLFVVSEVAGS